MHLGPYVNSCDAASRGTATGESATHSSKFSYISTRPLKIRTTTYSYLPLITTYYHHHYYYHYSY